VATLAISGAAQEAPAPDAARAARSARLLFSGDVLPHLGVVRTACPRGRCDFAALLAPTKSLVSEVDLAVCHLEVPIVRPGQRIIGYPSFGSPWALARGLAETGWDHCSTASNHSIDRGMSGIDSTLDALDSVGITHAGTARTVDEAREVDVREVNGIKVAHISATYGLNGLRLPKGQGWRVRRIDTSSILSAAGAAKEAGVPVVIVSLHWGVEYRHAPTAEQQKIARVLMTSGKVDLIVGHHAHVVQPIRNVAGKWVVYGLGNHVSGQVPRGRKLAVQDGLLVEVRLVEQPDGSVVVEQPIAYPTWNSPVSKKVYLTRQLPSNAQARSSAARTQRIVGSGFINSGD
jgi:hypothetical protein